MNPTTIEAIESTPDGHNVVVRANDTGRQYSVFITDEQLLGMAAALPAFDPPTTAAAAIPAIEEPPVDASGVASDDPGPLPLPEVVELPDGAHATVEGANAADPAA